MDSSANPVGEEAVRAELNRILASRKLSPSQAKLLSHVVDHCLRGDLASLKETILGIEVFDRHADFDPRIDPIVRVQAAKLRGRLADYYAGPGAMAPVVIDMPRGGYVPVFRLREPRRRKTMPLQWILTAGAPLIAVILLGAYLWTAWFSQSRALSIASLRQVTFDMEISTFPAISPDGRWIAFSADEGGKSNLNLFLMPTAGGAKPFRLTGTFASDITPDFSPDGETIVFRSNRGDGGIYRIPAHGGAETLVAAKGWNPRFSPDGKWIVYTGESGRPGGDLFVVAANPLTSTPPRALATGGLHISGVPLWTPDGSQILFVAWKDDGSSGPSSGGGDWWSIRWNADGGGSAAPKPAGILPVLGVRAGAATSGSWFEDHFIFGVRQDNSSSIWEARLQDGATFAKPRRLTFGTGLEGFPRIDRSGRVVFVSDHQPTHLWQYPVDWRNGAVIGAPQQLTNDSSLQPGGFVDPPRVGWAGEWLAYASSRSGNSDIWIRNLHTHQERQITANPWPESQPLLSRDARHVVYRASRQHGQDIMLSDTQNLSSRLLCSDCGVPECWSADGAMLLALSESGDLRRIQMPGGATDVVMRRSDIPNGQNTRLRHADCDPHGDNVLLTFLGFPGSRGSVFLSDSIANLRNPASWRSLVPDDTSVESAHFSGEGRTAVYLSTRDPGLSLRTASVDRNSSGILLPFYDARQRPWSKWLAVGPDGIIIRLTESRSTLWTGQISR